MYCFETPSLPNKIPAISIQGILLDIIRITFVVFVFFSHASETVVKQFALFDCRQCSACSFVLEKYFKFHKQSNVRIGII